MLRYAGVALLALLVVLSIARHVTRGCGHAVPALRTVGPARWLAAAIVDVPCGGVRVRYDVRDNVGAPLDALDPIDDPAAAGGGYLGVYHSPIGSGRRASFFVSLARSTDLLHWRRIAVLVPHGASMPTLRPVAGGFVLAYEQSGGLYNGDTVALRWYPTEAALASARPAAAVDLPLVLSRFNDGTPSIEGIAWHGSPQRSLIALRFHYQSAAGTDREAGGAVAGFTRWASVGPDRATDAALTAAGFTGSHGDRRTFAVGGAAAAVYEAQSRPGGFANWRVLLRTAPEAGSSAARFVPLRLGLAGGPFAASFGNPIVSVVRAPRGASAGAGVLAVTVFVFGVGPAASHAGELVYFQRLVDVKAVGQPQPSRSHRRSR